MAQEQGRPSRQEQAALLRSTRSACAQDLDSRSAQVYATAQHSFDAASALRAAGSMSQALQSALAIPAAAPQFPGAARLVIAVCAAQRNIKHEVEEFLEPYLELDHGSVVDQDALFLLGQLYEVLEYTGKSQWLFGKVAQLNPHHPVHAYLRANPQRPEQATLETEASGADLKAVRKMLQHTPSRGEAAFDEGSLVAGRYLLESTLGAGSSATVYRATDVTNNSALALKVALFTDRDLLATRRFRREALLATRLVHPNIVRVYDIGQQDGHGFLTMELVDGIPLSNMLAEGQKLVLSETCELLLQALAGLTYAHGQGVVHRDIKPENMLVSSRGVLKLTDFGLAKGNDDERLTTRGSMAGTPSYISPEQITDVSNADGRSDLYSLGAMAYELFTGQCPFDGPSLTDLLLKHLNEPPAPPRSINPALPEALQDWVLRLLRKRPEERYRSSEEAARTLRLVSSALA
jgi:hypothetical protein